jgi:hypothetical protein
MRIILLSFFIIIVITGCENESQKIDPTLTGRWEWIRTEGGFNAHIHETPTTTGNSYLLKFAKDNKILISRNDTTIFTGEYEIKKEESIYSGKVEDYIKNSGSHYIQNLVISGILKLNNDTLTISDNAHDGLSSNYKRVN